MGEWHATTMNAHIAFKTYKELIASLRPVLDLMLLASIASLVGDRYAFGGVLFRVAFVDSLGDIAR